MTAEAFAPDFAHVLRILVAVLLGGLIGLERELRDKPAGFRTIILICVGACLFTIISQAVGGPEQYSSQIAAQIVTGIGFLGAGAILRERGSVVGLTTASSIWATAAVGMTVGFGHIGLALVGTGVILGALWLLSSVEQRIAEWREVQEYVVATANTDGAFERVLETFTQAGLTVYHRGCFEEGPALVVQVVAAGRRSLHASMRVSLARSPDFTLRRD